MGRIWEELRRETITRTYIMKKKLSQIFKVREKEKSRLSPKRNNKVIK